MGRIYGFLALCLGLFGWMAASLTRMSAPADPRMVVEVADGNSQPSSDSHDDSPRLAELSSGDAITLERQPDGHFYADVDINGTPIRMLVDTGASTVALSVNDARRAGIATSIGMHDAIGEGANGAIFGDVADIPTVRLGRLEANHVPGVILRDGQMSLLGQSFLRQFNSVEITGDAMTLR